MNTRASDQGIIGTAQYSRLLKKKKTPAETANERIPFVPLVSERHRVQNAGIQTFCEKQIINARAVATGKLTSGGLKNQNGPSPSHPSEMHHKAQNNHVQAAAANQLTSRRQNNQDGRMLPTMPAFTDKQLTPRRKGHVAFAYDPQGFDLVQPSQMYRKKQVDDVQAAAANQLNPRRHKTPVYDMPTLQEHRHDNHDMNMPAVPTKQLTPRRKGQVVHVNALEKDNDVQFVANPLTPRRHKSQAGHVPPTQGYRKDHDGPAAAANQPPTQRGHQNPTATSPVLPASAYKLWIHCNHCFEPYIERRRPAFLLSCQHIFCSNCLESATPAAAAADRSSEIAYKCKICEQIVRAYQIGNDLPSHIRALFDPAPWKANYSMKRIMDFQKYHRDHLKSGIPLLHAKLRKLKAKTEQSHSVSNDLMEKNRKLKVEIAELEHGVRCILREREREQESSKQKSKDQAHIFHSTLNCSVLGPPSSVAQRCLARPSSRNARGRLQVLSFEKFAAEESFEL